MDLNYSILSPAVAIYHTLISHHPPHLAQEGGGWFIFRDCKNNFFGYWFYIHKLDL